MPMNPHYAAYALQVTKARQNIRPFLSESIAALGKSLHQDDIFRFSETYAPWANELATVNEHITVNPKEIEAAAEAYWDVARHLIKELQWPDEAIQVLVQGSASTKTLIRSPAGNEKFDIDAVCQIDISHIEARYPMRFFEWVGQALASFEPTRQKRCWKINFRSKPFYIEFTPSVPWDMVPVRFNEAVSLHYSPVERYGATALAVVDTPTQGWKPSNPAGMSQWVNDIATLRLLQQLVFREAVLAKAEIEVVPDQQVGIEDTLRVAIRLFKRHRDMCVRRNLIEKDTQPISIIIVTLLTTCYAGLHALGHTYRHPLELLVDLAELLPGMITRKNGEHWVANPTVDGENFAEKWNTDGGTRYLSFHTWCGRLAADLRLILAAKDPQDIRTQVREVFGLPSSASPTTGLFTGIGLGGTPATRRPPPPPPRTQGLA